MLLYGEAHFTIPPIFLEFCCYKITPLSFWRSFLEVEGEEGSDGEWVTYSSLLGLFVLVLLIQQAASSDLLPRGIAGSLIPSFHPCLSSPLGRDMWCPPGVSSVSPTFSPFLPPDQCGTGCGEVGEVSSLCPPVPVHPRPVLHPEEGQISPDQWVVISMWATSHLTFFTLKFEWFWRKPVPTCVTLPWPGFSGWAEARRG